VPRPTVGVQNSVPGDPAKFFRLYLKTTGMCVGAGLGNKLCMALALQELILHPCPTGLTAKATAWKYIIIPKTMISLFSVFNWG